MSFGHFLTNVDQKFLLAVGGNSAGLLNFGKQPCPYDLVTPWEFGTRHQVSVLQKFFFISDIRKIKLKCLSLASNWPY
jgi:hypothetical protein